MPSITSQRLHNQHLSHQTLNDPALIVQHLGAVQAQEYPHARWAIGMRSLNLTDSTIEQAFNDGAILRTHLMRPTWHFVARDDIRWMLDLTAPRVHTANSHYYKLSELDPATLSRSNDLLTNALQNNNYLTRKELLTLLEQRGIPAGNTIRSSYIMMYAELEGLICSGPRRGNQFTYALISERAPNALTLDRDEALAQLVKRYFSSHGPATIPDFVWWSGLTVAATKRGLDLNKSHLASDTINNTTYYFPDIPSTITPIDAATTAHLLPIYDEYGNSYKGRDDLSDPSYFQQLNAGNLPTISYQCPLAVGGKILGSWKRTLTKNDLLIEASFYRPLTPPETDTLNKSIARFAAFHALPATLQSRVL